jgi:AhpD family alkylhydroperoxidase
VVATPPIDVIMARLSYPDPGRPELAGLVGRMIAERGELLHLYQLLLHSPPIAEGWLALLTAIRQRTGLDGAIRELVIMRIAILNGAPYEAAQHEPIALSAGISQAQLAALAHWQQSDAFTPVQRAVLAYTDAMTIDVQVPEEIFAGVREVMDERGTLELTATVAAYNLVSRFLEALEIRESDPRPERPA